jgi:ubiquinone/menaquinone biosynthesis C-methylase UbiE
MSEPHSFDLDDDRQVAFYDEAPLWSTLAGTLLLEHVPLDARRALDLGCGTGFPLLELAERLGPAARVAGLDPWRAAVSRAGAKRDAWPVPGAGLVRGDGAAMPFRSTAFDLVVSNLGVNNFADVDAALAECRRVLRPGGRLALATNLAGTMRELYAAFERALAGDAAALERLARHVAHRVSIESLGGRLEAAGLRVTVVHRREAVLRFANATALFEHHFMRLGFRAAWEEVAGGAAGVERLRDEVDARARADGEVRLTVPFAYVEAQRE